MTLDAVACSSIAYDPALEEGARQGRVGAPLEARLLALLDRGRPRVAGDLDLADAVLGLRFPEHWPAYRGGLDLGSVSRALDRLSVGHEDLAWIASPAFARGATAA